jgi:hypothetical protein
MQGSLQLLRHGADLGFRERVPSRSWSWPIPDTPLAMTVDSDQIEIAKVLIDHDVEVLQDRPYEEHDRKRWNCRSSTDYPDSYGRTLLSWAAQIEHEAGVRRPISMPHVDVNISENRLRGSFADPCLGLPRTDVRRLSNFYSITRLR